MSQIHVSRIFPTTIFSVKINNHQEFNKPLLKEIYKHKKNNKSYSKSNVGGFHSSIDIHKNKAFNKLSEFILDTMNEIVENDYNFELYKNQNIRVKEIEAMWYMINNKNHYNSKHIHPNTWISGAYYLKIPTKESSKLLFEDPVRVRGYTDECSYNIYAHGIEEGVLVLFPGWLYHEVPVNTSDKDRVVISFNICKPT